MVRSVLVQPRQFHEVTESNPPNQQRQKFYFTQVLPARSASLRNDMRHLGGLHTLSRNTVLWLGGPQHFVA